MLRRLRRSTTWYCGGRRREREREREGEGEGEEEEKEKVRLSNADTHVSIHVVTLINVIYFLCTVGWRFFNHAEKAKLPSTQNRVCS